jgi:hypothetical protein
MSWSRLLLSWVPSACLLVGLACLSVNPLIVWAEELTISTLYPSPKGIYQVLRTTEQVIIGDIGTAIATSTPRLLVIGAGGTVDAFRVASSFSASPPFFAIDSAGNTTIGGTLTVADGKLTTLNGGLTMDTNKFTVADTTGDTSIEGTLSITGYVGLGTAPDATYRLKVNGDIKATGFVYDINTPSDARLKHNIQPLGTDALTNVLALNGVAFEWNTDGQPGLGVVAQEVERVFPELVVMHPVTGFKGVQYNGLIAPIIEAIKAQQQQVDEQQRQLDALRTELEALRRDTPP